ncbi:MAG: NADH-quinone oxidoreductase subunit N [Actinobacteria bacterium]|nr:NADH-quinone oxidoreductase subunit N [Actinomycetota bacterium]
MLETQAVDYHAILPELIVSGTILLVIVVDVFLGRDRKWWAMPISLVGTAGALAATLTLIGERRETFDGMFVVDPFAVLFKVFFLGTAIVVLAISLRYFREGRYFQGEYYFLLLTAFLGSLTIASSRDLLMLFISLELVSAPGFLIAAFRKSDPRSNESGLKFFLIGVLSAAVMLYGMSLIYGVTGTTRLDGIAEALAGPAGEGPLPLAAIFMVIVGFGFKVSAVPFQFWAPDTYEGAPVPVAAFLSVASKAAGFAGLLILMFLGFGPLSEFWTPIFFVLSAATMTIGNLLALQQTQVVRLLAYSSIAQAGYMLLPFALVGGSVGNDRAAFAASMLYILIYGVMNLGAFTVVVAIARDAPGVLVSDFAGLSRRAPVLAIGMGVFLVSLGGIPPTAGFWAKFFIFTAAIERGGLGVWLAAIMVVNSVISLYYYLAIAKQMFFAEGEDRPLASPALLTGVAALAMVAVIVLGVYPDLFARFPPGATLVP